MFIEAILSFCLQCKADHTTLIHLSRVNIMIVKQIQVQILDPCLETNDGARKPWNPAALVVVDKFASIFSSMASLI